MRFIPVCALEPLLVARRHDLADPAMNSLRKLFLLSVLLLPAVVNAAVINDFYRVQLPQAEEQPREELMREALEVMLVRLGGAQALATNAGIDEALKEPRNLMRRIAARDGGGVDVEFEPGQLRDLLAAAQRPMLGPTRPGVMLWATEATTFGDEFVGQAGEWGTALSGAAQHRAVGLSFPLVDLEDRSQVSEADIAAANGEVLVAATQRYDASAALALHIQQRGEGWQLDWHLWLNDKSESGQIRAEDADQAADELMLLVANQVFSQYAVPAKPRGEMQKWQIVVEDIQGLDAFASLQRILQQLGSQVSPQILSISAGQVRMAFDFPGSEDQLERLLALDQRLIRTEAPAPKPVEPVAEVPTTAINVLEDDPILLPEVAESELEAPEPPAADPVPESNVLYYRWR